jgi:hypothetical protein
LFLSAMPLDAKYPWDKAKLERLVFARRVSRESDLGDPLPDEDLKIVRVSHRGANHQPNGEMLPILQAFVSAVLVRCLHLDLGREIDRARVWFADVTAQVRVQLPLFSYPRARGRGVGRTRSRLDICVPSII